MVYGVAVIAWDIAWLRILLWVVIVWIGYFLMSRYKALSSVVVTPLVFISILCFYFDDYPVPNYILSQLGWVWAALGLSLAATMLVRWLFSAPTALDLLRQAFRQILIDVERACLPLALGPNLKMIEIGNIGEVLKQTEKLRKFKILTPIQVANCRRVGTAVQAIATLVLSNKPDAAQQGLEEKNAWLQMARHLHGLRHSILTGRRESIFTVQHSLQLGKVADAEKLLIEAQSGLDGEDASDEGADAVQKREMVPVPEFTDFEFATRATAATMGCYLFASLTDWSGIHTSMITCAVTALSTIDSQIFKQRLRIFGAAFGGALGVLSVAFLIPNMNNLMGVLIIVALERLSAHGYQWVERNSPISAGR